MKKRMFLMLALTLVCCLAAAPALADARTVTAEGSATVTVAPDSATFSAGVTTQDVLVTAAQSANADAMQAVLAALKAQGVAEEDLQTYNYSVNPVYDYSSDSYDPTIKGYSVTNTVQVTVRDLYPDAAVAAGATETYGIDFQSTQSSAAYDQALKAAVEDALRKASLMAQALERTTGDVLSLTETDTYDYSTRNFAYMALDSASSTPIQSGTLSVTAGVTAVVELN
jgi:uncharacterized protein YggE